MTRSTARAAYDMWPQYNRRLREVVRDMSAQDLAVRPSADGWPIWAIVGHTAGARVYWLCEVAGETGADSTPFSGSGVGWEDDLDHPRGADELVGALDSTFGIVQGVLDRWTLDMLADEIQRPLVERSRSTRADPFFSGCSATRPTTAVSSRRHSGIHGLPQIDLWRPD